MVQLKIFPFPFNAKRKLFYFVFSIGVNWIFNKKLLINIKKRKKFCVYISFQLYGFCRRRQSKLKTILYFRFAVFILFFQLKRNERETKFFFFIKNLLLMMKGFLFDIFFFLILPDKFLLIHISIVCVFRSITKEIEKLKKKCLLLIVFLWPFAHI